MTKQAEKKQYVAPKAEKHKAVATISGSSCTQYRATFGDNAGDYYF